MRTLKRIFHPRALVAILVAGFAIGCSPEGKKSDLLNRADRYFESNEYDKAKIEYLKLLRADPENATAIRQLGAIWFEQGAPLNAAPFLLKARDLAPEDLDARTKLALVFMSVGQFAEARKEALAILDRSPGHNEAMLLLAESSRSQQEREDTEQRLKSLDADNKTGFHLALAGLALRKHDLASADSAVKHALSLDPNSVEAHLALGKLYWLRNDLTKADQEFKAATRLAPLRSPPQVIYAEFMVRTGRADEAKARLEQITREAPDFLAAWRLLAQIALGEKQFEDSLKLTENILLRDPPNIEARLLQAQVLLAKGDTKKAIESLERLDAAYSKLLSVKYDLARAYLQDNNATQAAAVSNQLLSENPSDTEAQLLLGETDLRKGNAQQVVASMLDLLKRRPDLAQAELLLARAYQSLGRLDDAAAVFRKQIKASPQNPRSHLLLGLILRQQGKIEEARKVFEDAQRSAPANLFALSQLVDLDVQNGSFETALQRIGAELQKTPRSPGAHFLQAKVYAAQRQWDPAEAALLKTLELDPNSADANDLLISAYLASNKLPHAVARLESLLSKSPDNANARMLLALTHEKMNEFAKARDAYEKVLLTKPDFAPALNNLAFLYAERLNEFDKAYELAQKARILQPGDAVIADTLGWILYKRGDYKQAIALLQESARNLPNNPEIQYHLGMASYMMGRTDEARIAFRQASAAPIDFPGKDEAERRLSLLDDEKNKETPRDLEVMLKEQPDDPLAQVRLGESYEKRGAFAQAARSYEKAITLNPNLLSAITKLAQLYAGPLQEGNKALELAKKARKLAPNDPRVLGILGDAAYQTGNFAWAYSLLQESVRQLPDDAEILHNFAWSAYSLGKVGEARNAMQRVVAAHSDSGQSSDAKLFLEMTALIEDGANPVAAEPEVEGVLKENPGYVPALMAKGEILLQRGKSIAATTNYNEVLRRFPDFAPAQKRLAALHAQDPERRDQAYELVMKARKVLPDDPELAQILGELCYQRKEFAYAAQLLQRSSAKRPLDAKLLYYLGMSQFNANEKTESRDALRQALAAGLPDSLASEAKSALAEIEKN